MKGEFRKMRCLTLFLVLFAMVSSTDADVKDDYDLRFSSSESMENTHNKRSVELIGPLLNSLSSSMGGSNDYRGSAGGSGLLGLVGNLINNAMGVTFGRDGINMNLKTTSNDNNQESRSGSGSDSGNGLPRGLGLNFDLTKIGSNVINGYRVGKAAGSAGGGFLNTILTGVNGVADSLSMGSMSNFNNVNQLPPPRRHPPPPNNPPPPPQQPSFDGPHPPQPDHPIHPQRDHPVPPHPDHPLPSHPDHPLPSHPDHPHPRQPNHPIHPEPNHPLPQQHGPFLPPPPHHPEGPFLPPPPSPQLPHFENQPMPQNIQHENVDSFRGPPRDIVHEHSNRPINHENFREEGRHVSSEKPNEHHENRDREPDDKPTRRPNKNKGSRNKQKEDDDNESSSSTSRTSTNDKPNGRNREQEPHEKNANNNNNLEHPRVHFVELVPMPQPVFTAHNGHDRQFVGNIQVPVNGELVVDGTPGIVGMNTLHPQNAAHNEGGFHRVGHEAVGESNVFKQLVPDVGRGGFVVVPGTPIYDGRPSGYNGNNNAGKVDGTGHAIERGPGQHPISSFLQEQP